VLLICPHTHRSAISNYIDNNSTSSSFGSLRIDVQGIEDVSESQQGTSAILLHFANRIKTDFILLPCDFIPPSSLPLTQVLNMFRAHVGAEEGIMTACWFETPNDKPPFEENDGTAGAVPILWNAASSTLLYVSSINHRDSEGDEIALRASLLSKCVLVCMLSYTPTHGNPDILAFGCLRDFKTLMFMFAEDLSSMSWLRNPV
jgi:translation initiation factor eIF-2B subunit gamma